MFKKYIYIYFCTVLFFKYSSFLLYKNVVSNLEDREVFDDSEEIKDYFSKKR